MYESFELNSPDKFTTDAIGEPGQREFYIQAQEGTRVATLKIEKQQLHALSKFVADQLAEVSRPGHLPDDDELELTQPATPDWIVGPITVDFDATLDRFVVSCEQATWDDTMADLDALPATAVFRITREQMAAFAIRAVRLVEAGRPPCPLCGFPLDAKGHSCPRTNGHSQPTL